MPCMQVDVDDLLDDPELERLHAERLAAMQAGRSTEPCTAGRTCCQMCQIVAEVAVCCWQAAGVMVCDQCPPCPPCLQKEAEKRAAMQRKGHGACLAC